MIGSLKGLVETIGDDHVVLDVGGVGYVAFIHQRLRLQLAEGQAARLTIETHVREDHIHLYGFADTAERDWFRLLLGVERVGGRMALAILGQLSPDQLTHAILAKDVNAFRSISGVGPKLAERLVLELKDKALNAPHVPLNVGKAHDKKATQAGAQVEDAVSALVGLGFSRSDAYRAATLAAKEPSAHSVDALIKLSLKQLAAA